jgi:3-dehydroquinate synthase
MVRVRVGVPGGSYDVLVGRGVLSEADAALPPLPKAERAFVVADAEVAGRYLPRLEAALARRGLQVTHLGVPAGEEAKSLETTSALYRQLAMQEAHRDDLVVALGGGAVGDLAGFVAATYMRGIAVVQVPTTLTAQVDAAIGGKTAVNLPQGKNLVGAFHQPVAVVADVESLETVSDRDFRSGLAEVAKYALTLDPNLLAMLETDPSGILRRDLDVLEHVVAASVRAKADVVADDERDAGRRLVLNYGHTLGHALERLDRYAGRTHGEAVALGMVFAARIAEGLRVGGPGLAGRHVRLLTSLGLEAEGRIPSTDRILPAMRLDKKYSSGIRLVLLEDVGRPVIADDVAEETIVATLKELGAEG